MVKRILAIDIGNTAATVGFYEGGRLSSFESISYNAIPKYAKKVTTKIGTKISLNIVNKFGIVKILFVVFIIFSAVFFINFIITQLTFF